MKTISFWKKMFMNFVSESKRVQLQADYPLKETFEKLWQFNSNESFRKNLKQKRLDLATFNFGIFFICPFLFD